MDTFNFELTDEHMDTYVLVHGAWHDGNLLKDVAKAIESDGHKYTCQL